MENFDLQLPTKIIFGKGTENQVGEEIKPYGTKVLLHYGGGSIKRSGLYDKVIASLSEAGIEFIELPGVKPNPRLSLVREGIKLCRENQVDLILAVGGGSVIDSAKAIGIGVPYQGDVWDFFARKAVVKESLPVGVVLTIPAAGSESSKNSVITNEDGWYKRGHGSDLMRPKFAIMNPELTYTLPPYQIACGASDIIAHIMERYFTNTPHVDLTDRLCEATLKTVIHNVPLALQQPENYDARAEIMWASTIAHNDLLSTGRIGDWASHAIEHELSAIYDVAHGAGLAVVFPAWMRYVYKHKPEKFVQFALRVWNIDYIPNGQDEMVLAGIEQLKNFYKSIGLPTSLAELGIGEERLEEMAAKCTNSDSTTVGNFVKLRKADVLNIYHLAK